MNRELSISLVIPVYNEERYIKSCLDAIARQTVKPLEVIVVDNNCTDNTIQIARGYSFVQILKESKQHQLYAQVVGFDHATGDIFARIDADCVLPPDWTEKVQAAFNDQNIVAITGVADPYDVPLKRIAIAIFGFYEIKMMRFFTGKTMLWNSNAAFRARCWPDVKKKMRFADNIWEDHEMSYWLAELGEVKLDKNLKVGCSFRSIHKSFFTQLAYQFRAVRVFSYHNSRLKTVVFFFAWYSMIPIFILAVIDRNLLKLRSHNHS